jgi:DNA-binding transcriptional MerR regulator
MDPNRRFDRTTGRIARDAEVSAPTVRLYANLNLLPCVLASDGTRLFPADAGDLVREIYAKRLGNRGRRQPAQTGMDGKAA